MLCNKSLLLLEIINLNHSLKDGQTDLTVDIINFNEMKNVSLFAGLYQGNYMKNVSFKNVFQTKLIVKVLIFMRQ
jgi:hypothetical protein